MRRIASAAVVVSLVAGGALTSTIPSAGAAPPPTVSATSGGPGTIVEVSVADCVTDEDSDVFQFLQVRLVSGTAPDEVLAGAGSSDVGTATFVVPDWVDAADPASIEASCFVFDFDSELPVVTIHDPVAFDVLPGPGPATQVRTFNRTSLEAGQAMEVEAEGCDLTDATWAGVDVLFGDDLSGRTFDEVAAFGDGDLDGSDFVAQAVMSNGWVSTFISAEGDPPVVTEIEVEEEPTALPPGSYTAVAYCADDDGNTLLYEPQLLTITGDAPIGDLDLVLSAAGDRATLAGGSCTSGPVEVFMEAFSFDDLFEDGPEVPFAAARSTDHPTMAASGLALAAAPSAVGRAPARSWGAMTAAGSLVPQGLADDEYLEATVEPDEAGAWEVSDDTGFEQQGGMVLGYAICGDPLEEGWYYDPQGVGVLGEVSEPPPPPVVPPAAPPVTGPEAVPAAPTYAG